MHWLDSYHTWCWYSMLPYTSPAEIISQLRLIALKRSGQIKKRNCRCHNTSLPCIIQKYLRCPNQQDTLDLALVLSSLLRNICWQVELHQQAWVDHGEAEELILKVCRFYVGKSVLCPHYLNWGWSVVKLNLNCLLSVTAVVRIRILVQYLSSSYQ